MTRTELCFRSLTCQEFVDRRTRELVGQAAEVFIEEDTRSPVVG